MPVLRPRDGSFNKNNSTGVIAGIVIACLVIITASAIFLGNRLYKARHQRPSPPLRVPPFLQLRKKTPTDNAVPVQTQNPILKTTDTITNEKTATSSPDLNIRPETSTSEAAGRYWDADSVGKPPEARTKPPPSRGSAFAERIRRTEIRLPTFHYTPLSLSPILSKFSHSKNISLASIGGFRRNGTADSHPKTSHSTKPIINDTNKPTPDNSNTKNKSAAPPPVRSNSNNHQHHRGANSVNTLATRPGSKHLRTGSRHISVQVADFDPSSSDGGVRSSSRTSNRRGSTLPHGQLLTQSNSHRGRHRKSNSLGGSRTEFESRGGPSRPGRSNSTGNMLNNASGSGTGRNKNPLSVITDLNWMEYDHDF